MTGTTVTTVDNSQPASPGTAKVAATSSTVAGTADGSGNATMSLADLPYRDPAPLQDLMALNDADFQNQLTNNWPYVGGLIDEYIPPDVTLYPAPRGFYGPMSSCRQQHGLPACREFFTQLIGLMQSKAPTT